MRSRVSCGLVIGGFVVGALVIGALVSDGDAVADLDNSTNVFTSRVDRVRMVVPRNWRGTDVPSYPGLLLWLTPRNHAAGEIVLTAEALSRDLYCSWPVVCRTSRDPMPLKYYCALRSKLESQRFQVGGPQSGPKESEAAGLPSIWFDYDDGKHFLRHALATGSDRAFSLVLSAPSNEARASFGRPFDQALRTIQVLPPEPVAPSPAAADAGIAADSAGSAEPAPPPPTPAPTLSCP